MQNIFVPTKARVDNCTLIKKAEEDNVRLTIVVEPQDFKAYLNRFGYNNFDYLTLPEDNRGIGYARNEIKKFCEAHSIDYYWQLDDDINGLFYREGTKLIRGGFELLDQGAEKLVKAGVALGGFEYRQFAWSATKELITNTFCNAVTFFDMKQLKGIHYRQLEGKEDLDFAMQVIKADKKTGRLTIFAHSSPPLGSNRGGLKEIHYDVDNCAASVKKMVELWGSELCQPIIRENGRHDLKIAWDKINSKQCNLF